MFWGCISRKYRKGPHLFWKKAWKNITAASYSEHILPLLEKYIAVHPGLWFQQDNAGPHAAVYTTFQFMCAGIEPIKQLLFLLDLHPIETVWDQLKDYIEAIDSTIHRSYVQLQKVILQAWKAFDNTRILELVSEKRMRERCQAVIDANGINTKY